MGQKSGLEERLEKILEDHATNIGRYQGQIDDLRAKYKFYQEHNLEEEKRIASIKVNQMDMLLYEYKGLYKEVQEALIDWNK